VRIVDVESFVVGNPWKAWYFTLVHTDEGVTGIGEGEGYLWADALQAFAEQNKELLFLGQDPFRIEEIRRRCRLELYERWGYGHVSLGVLAAVECACFDIVGKALGVPCSTLLGGRIHDRLRVYANGWYTHVMTPESWGERAREIVEEHGYTALKFDPFGSAYRELGLEGLRTAEARTAAVREAVGDDVDLIIEAHGRFSIAEAVRVGRMLEPFGILWYEAPLHNFMDADAHLQVKQKVNVPIATDLAAIKDRYECLEFCRKKAVDVLQPDFRHNGGVLETKFMAEVAETFAIQYAPHQANGPIGTAIYAQLNSTCTNFLIQEHFEKFASPEWLPEVFPDYLIAGDDGFLDVPEAPGWGVSFDPEAARRYPITNQAGMISLFKPGWERRSFAAPPR
jgi:galactonate dehydratase